MTRHWMHLLMIPALFATACADSIDDQGAPPDPEFGLESIDQRDDSYGVRPGTPEAAAVVAFVNQPIVDNTEGQRFFTLLDSKLHATAARNIVAYRAGSDGDHGTADDATFADLKAVDEVPYVGRVALMQLYDLALAAGYDNRGATSCSDYLTPRNGTFTLRTYEDLLVIEQSGCTTFDGNVKIEFADVYMPTRARRMASLDQVSAIEGDLSITAKSSFDEIALRGLTSLTGKLTVHAQSRQAVSIPAITRMEDAVLTGIGTYDFASLESLNTLEINAYTPVAGFPALKNLGSLTLYAASPVSIELPALTEIERRLLVRGFLPTTAVGGSFASLKSTGSIEAQRMTVSHLSMPKLTTVHNNLTITEVTDPDAPFSALKTVGGQLRLQNVKFSDTGSPVGGFNKLTAAGSVYLNTTVTAFAGFGALESVNGLLDLYVRCTNSFDGFNKLTSLGALRLAASCAVRGFDVLEEVEGSVTVEDATTFDALGQLAFVGGNVAMRNRLSQDLPALVWVAGNLSVDAPGVTDFATFNALETVDGNLTLLKFRNLTGLQQLTGVGQNIVFPTQLNRTDADRVLDQLTEFSGSVSFR